MMEIRPATRQDFEEFYGELPPMTTRCLAGIEDGKTVGMAGYYIRENAAVVFTDFKEGLSKRNIVRGARAVVDLAKKLKVDLIAFEGMGGEKALRHFGFESEGKLWRFSV